MDEKDLMMEEVAEDAAEEIAKVKTGMSIRWQCLSEAV